jgi:hypothetical protein
MEVAPLKNVTVPVGTPEPAGTGVTVAISPVDPDAARLVVVAACAIVKVKGAAVDPAKAESPL